MYSSPQNFFYFFSTLVTASDMLAIMNPETYITPLPLFPSFQWWCPDIKSKPHITKLKNHPEYDLWVCERADPGITDRFWGLAKTPLGAYLEWHYVRMAMLNRPTPWLFMPPTL